MALQGYPQLQARLRAIGGTSSSGVLQKLAVSTVREAKLLVPRRTSNLGRSIHIASVTRTRAIVAVSANYAGYVEFGTRPHEIRPRMKKALFFASQKIVNERFGPQANIFRLSGSLKSGAMRRFGNAAFVVTKRVHHPGTRPHPFLGPGALKAVSKAGLGEEIVKLWNSAA